MTANLLSRLQGLTAPDREVDALAKAREAAHNAPLNKVFTDHTGHRHLGTHSMAWAKAGREYCAILTALEARDA